MSIQSHIIIYSYPSRRFPVEDIPDDEQECASWLHKLYQEKVKLRKTDIKTLENNHKKKKDWHSSYLLAGLFVQFFPPRKKWFLKKK